MMKQGDRILLNRTLAQDIMSLRHNYFDSRIKTYLAISFSFLVAVFVQLIRDFSKNYDLKPRVRVQR